MQFLKCIKYDNDLCVFQWIEYLPVAQFVSEPGIGSFVVPFIEGYGRFPTAVSYPSGEFWCVPY